MKLRDIITKAGGLTVEQETSFMSALKECSNGKEDSIKTFCAEVFKENITETQIAELISNCKSNKYGLKEEVNPDDNPKPTPMTGETSWQDGYLAGYNDGMETGAQATLNMDSAEFKAGYEEGFNAAMAEKDSEAAKKPKETPDPAPAVIPDPTTTGDPKPIENSYTEGCVAAENDKLAGIIREEFYNNDNEFNKGYSNTMNNSDNTQIPSANEDYSDGYAAGYTDCENGKTEMAVPATDISEYAQGYRDGWNSCVDDKKAASNTAANQQIKAVMDSELGDNEPEYTPEQEAEYNRGYMDGLNDAEVKADIKVAAEDSTPYAEGYRDGYEDGVAGIGDGSEETPIVPDTYEAGYSEGFNDAYNGKDRCQIAEGVVEFTGGYEAGYRAGTEDRTTKLHEMKTTLMFCKPDVVKVFNENFKGLSKGTVKIEDALKFVNENIHGQICEKDYDHIVEMLTIESGVGGRVVEMVKPEEQKPVVEKSELLGDLSAYKRQFVIEKTKGMKPESMTRVFELASSIDENSDFETQVTSLIKEITEDVSNTQVYTESELELLRLTGKPIK